MGRSQNSRNVGYYFRGGRGWYTTIEGKMIPLRGDDGKPLKLKTCPIATVKAAYRRIVAEPEPTGNGVTLLEVCDAYLSKILADGATTTYKFRGDILYDFCSGFPPRFREKPTPAKERLHKGYGNYPVVNLRPLDLDQWLQAHKGWKGSRRTKIQAVTRALNYGVQSGLIEASPLKGYKVPQNRARVTYITPEQEAALIAVAAPAVATAIKVLIRTGARPGSEFAKLTAQHVKDDGDKMAWTFQPAESKNRKLRTIRITDPDIMKLVRERMKNRGPIFRSGRGGPWQLRNLSKQFSKALAEAGVEFDPDCVLYSCRHTYAKRILQGFWSGKPTNIETLARLMGNTPQVCQANYLQWSDSYESPLWESA